MPDSATPTTPTDLFGDALPAARIVPVERPSLGIVPVLPDARAIEIVLTATTPVSHHDPAHQDDSNTLLFLRRRQFVHGHRAERGDPGELQSALDRVSQRHQPPASAAELLRDLPAAEFVGVAMVRLFCGLYGGGDGTGLFAGTGRYEMLETRLRSAAVRAVSLRALWNRITHDLQCPIAPADADPALLELFALPGALQSAVLRACVREYRSLVMLARYWHGEAKAQSEAYAEKAGREMSRESVVVPLSAASLLGEGSDALALEIPAVSSNTLRHQMVRAPGWRHMAAALSLPWGFAGDGSIPVGAEAIFENGGNIRAGAKQAGDPFGLAWEVRRTFPLLDLLGGVTDSFVLGEGRLKVAGWLVCRENREALAGTLAQDLPMAGVSAFDLLDDQTHTRQATERGAGQMIYNFETLSPGTHVYCRLVLSPFTDRRSAGALAAALSQFAADGALVGGQSARGYGWMRAEALSTDPDMAVCQREYEAYLSERRDELRAALESGTLGSRQKIVG